MSHRHSWGRERDRQRERQREIRRQREKEKEIKEKRERERIGCAIDTYTTYTVHLLLYLHAVELSV